MQGRAAELERVREDLGKQQDEVRTKTTETIWIDRPPRDPRTMQAVERACERLTALNITRGSPYKERRLVLTVVEPSDT